MSIFEFGREAWTEHATCATLPADGWDYPEGHATGDDVDRLHAAARICHTCPVHAECATRAEQVTPYGQIWAGVAYTNEGTRLNVCPRCALPCVGRNVSALWCSEDCRQRDRGSPLPDGAKIVKLRFPVWADTPSDLCKRRAIGRAPTKLKHLGWTRASVGEWSLRDLDDADIKRWANQHRPIGQVLEYAVYVTPRSTP
jgi:hypothetical protein